MKEAIRGPWRDCDAILPQEDGPPAVPTQDRPESCPEEWLHVETKKFTDSVNKNPVMAFLRNCTHRMSAFIESGVIRDMLHGANDGERCPRFYHEWT